MTFIRYAFLIIVLMSLNAFAQTHSQTLEQNNKLPAYKFDEYKKTTIKKLEPRLRKFFLEVIQSCSRGVTESCGTGNIVIYASDIKRTNLMLKPLRYFFREHSFGGFADRFDISRITLIKVKDKNERVEFWFIPKDAELPIFENAAKSETLQN